MTATFQTNLTDNTYHGWTNYETWNVSLWIQNDEFLYTLAQECDSYEDFLSVLKNSKTVATPDGVRYADPAVNAVELDTDVFDF
jgi:hypothetical protein